MVAVAVVSWSVWGSSLALAAPQTGFEVSPIYQNVSIGPNQPGASYDVTLANNTGADQAFKLSTVDFGSLNSSGGVAFLGASTSSFARKYGLAKWMTLNASTVTVPAGQEVQIVVGITNSETLASGGHYGAVLATALTAPSGTGANSRLGVYAVLSSLILLVKQGPGLVRGLSVATQTENGSWWRVPNSVTDELYNQGNVHVVPRGVVEVKDPLGHVIERGAINENSGIILPQNYRSYTTPLMSLVSARIPGAYTVVLNYRFDGTSASKTFSTSFFYLGGYGMLLIGLLILLVAAIAVTILLWRRGMVPILWRRRRPRG